MNLKKFFLDRLTWKNLDKSMIMLNKGFDQVAKSMDSFSKGMGELQSEISKDTERSNRESAKREKINEQNLDKIWGNKKDSLF